ncbi:DUF6508 domain-containing protein [Yinghuangia sp. YIM S09857]|uniref:DUF6508 domain-containing protein n=1 Tax=Yinghuangia sp. YIM S09857 TaxID=3436929 RepID=UPI003F53AAD5
MHDTTREGGGLTDALDTGNHDAWHELLQFVPDFATPQNDEVTWIPPKQRDDGVWHIGYPVYATRVVRAMELLYEVGAVTARVAWQNGAWPDHRKPGGLTPDEAVFAATRIARGDRFDEGTLGRAVTDGLFHAVLVALGGWYRDTTACRPARENPTVNNTPTSASDGRPHRRAPARHVYVGDHQHGQVTHIAQDGRTRLVWNADTKAFDVQELVWVTTGSWNKKQAHEQVKHGWDVATDFFSPA